MLVKFFVRWSHDKSTDLLSLTTNSIPRKDEEIVLPAYTKCYNEITIIDEKATYVVTIRHFYYEDSHAVHIFVKWKYSITQTTEIVDNALDMPIWEWSRIHPLG